MALSESSIRMESMNLLSSVIERAELLRVELGYVAKCSGTELSIIQHRIVMMNRDLALLRDMYQGK